jgi:hypothetical protein
VIALIAKLVWGYSYLTTMMFAKFLPIMFSVVLAGAGDKCPAGVYWKAGTAIVLTEDVDHEATTEAKCHTFSSGAPPKGCGPCDNKKIDGAPWKHKGTPLIKKDQEASCAGGGKMKATKIDLFLELDGTFDLKGYVSGKQKDGTTELTEEQIKTVKVSAEGAEAGDVKKCKVSGCNWAVVIIIIVVVLGVIGGGAALYMSQGGYADDGDDDDDEDDDE